ncbi:heavy metal-responsive transcriptional regulator [Zoogloea sp. LCSB751]|uniref:heavy metal-responsive transcriptional regulator n=1 Tax=Zoogloea sp. LCSB751 TaxID=1965277 RepID=UPI0009A5578F|nr:heavy metal-responsive transcriptional regulator [Zoogloea sp. LCSB751]
MDIQHFTIGTLAERAGVSIDTIRHYEREGLLSPPPRSAAGYRRYSVDAVERVRFICRAKTLGFTLEEIRDLLGFSNDREKGVRNVKQLATLRLQEINERINALIAIRDELAELVKACPGDGELECCPILNATKGAVPPLEDAVAQATEHPSCCGNKHATRHVASEDRP